MNRLIARILIFRVPVSFAFTASPAMLFLFSRTFSCIKLSEIKMNCMKIKKTMLISVLCGGLFILGFTVQAQVGIGIMTADPSAQLDVTSTVKGFLPPRMTAAQRDSIVSPAIGLMVYCINAGASGGEPEYYNGTAWVNFLGAAAALPITIGSTYQGGIVAYILVAGDPGYVAGQKHGLIAATADQSTGIQWFNGSNVTTGATGQALGTGLSNTNVIISAQGATSINYAAGLARAYNGGGYTDWYLPSIEELDLIYLNIGSGAAAPLTNIGGFIFAFYWSSTEDEILHNNVAIQYFRDGFLDTSIYKSNPYCVRAIRSF